MGRELQKKKNRSSIPKVKYKPKSKKVIVKGNATVKENWSQSLTLAQNYRHLGLVPRLKGRTGGTETAASSAKEPYSSSSKPIDSLSIARKSAAISELPLAQIERDPVTGAVRVIHKEKENDNPLNDPLNPITESDAHELLPTTVENVIVKELEEQAKSEAKKRPRQQSSGEEQWLARLVAKHGDEHGAMMRDTKLNRFQQTEGDIKRRIKQWHGRQAKPIDVLAE